MALSEQSKYRTISMSAIIVIIADIKKANNLEVFMNDSAHSGTNADIHRS